VKKTNNMTELLELIVGILTADTTLTAIVPAANILVGPVDMVQEKQPQALSPTALLYPQININISSESQRTVPVSARDTMIQIDIWSNNSQLELQNIYERVITLLSYQIANQGTAHIFWLRLAGAMDMNETDRRIWHKVMNYISWSLKP
jgi:hypothetical protein